VSITKTGGHVAWMLNTRGIGESKLSMEEMRQKAEAFLKEKGYVNMMPTYSMVSGDTGVVNFAYTQDGVIIYPDLLKVKVALDNGEVVGFEAQKFLMSHHDRDIRKPRLTEEEARKFISNQFNVSKGRLALIPLEDRTEVLTYEFKGKYQEDEFLIYINADTGDQEMILKIIKDKTGTLTM
jgi:germination protein YpeB